MTFGDASHLLNTVVTVGVILLFLGYAGTCLTCYSLRQPIALVSHLFRTIAWTGGILAVSSAWIGAMVQMADGAPAVTPSITPSTDLVPILLPAFAIVVAFVILLGVATWRYDRFERASGTRSEATA
jgi:heme A synthase